MDILAKPEATLPPQFTDPKVVSLLSPEQQQDYEKDVKFCKEQLANPQVQDKGTVRTRLRNLQVAYERQAPQNVQSLDKDRLARLEGKLRDKISEGMLTQEEMRRNPAGSVDKHMRWERANKKDILLWKKIKRVQASMDGGHPSTWDRESSNIDQIRPDGAVGRGYRGDAQIGGVMSYTDVPEEKWPFEAPPNTALEQVKKRRTLQLSEQERERRRQHASTIRAKHKANELKKQADATFVAEVIGPPAPGHAESPVVAESESTPPVE